MREFTRTWVSMNMGAKPCPRTCLFPLETQSLRPHRGGVDRPNLVQLRRASRLWATLFSEEQRLVIHIHLGHLPAGSTPGQCLAMPVATALGPPGPMKTRGRRQFEAYDCLDLTEGGSPLLVRKAAKMRVQPLILAADRHLPVLLLSIHLHGKPSFTSSSTGTEQARLYPKCFSFLLMREASRRGRVGVLRSMASDIDCFDGIRPDPSITDYGFGPLPPTQQNVPGWC